MIKVGWSYAEWLKIRLDMDLDDLDGFDKETQDEIWSCYTDEVWKWLFTEED